MTDQNATRGSFGIQPSGFRIFLASPGDVRDERELARAVIEQIRAERAFRGRVNLEIIAWDQPGAEVAMEAGLTPQEAIKRGLPKPSQCDLVIVILWSRMGTPLPADVHQARWNSLSFRHRVGVSGRNHAARRFGKPKVLAVSAKPGPGTRIWRIRSLMKSAGNGKRSRRFFQTL